MNLIACGYCTQCTEIADLKAEVARLRAVLQEISDMYPDGPCAVSIAERALISTSPSTTETP